MSERCWAKALLGQDLLKAVDDCSTALKRVGASSTGGAQVLVGRGLIRMRLGDYDKSLKDFDEALSARPKDAWALYGRGIDKVRRGRAGGDADMAAAAAFLPAIADDFAKHGMVP